jgi:hypothetical protein
VPIEPVKEDCINRVRSFFGAALPTWRELSNLRWRDHQGEVRTASLVNSLGLPSELHSLSSESVGLALNCCVVSPVVLGHSSGPVNSLCLISTVLHFSSAEYESLALHSGEFGSTKQMAQMGVE